MTTRTCVVVVVVVVVMCVMLNKAANASLGTCLNSCYSDETHRSKPGRPGKMGPPGPAGPPGLPGQCGCDQPDWWNIIPWNKKVDVCGLGVKDGSIENWQMTSSGRNPAWPQHSAFHARVDRDTGAGCWAPYKTKSGWIQVNFDKVITLAGVVTQGRARSYDQYIGTYKVAYGMSEAALVFVKDPNNPSADKVFLGNTDRNSHAIRMLPRPVKARFARIYPLVAAGPQGMCFRIEFLGC